MRHTASSKTKTSQSYRVTLLSKLKVRLLYRRIIYYSYMRVKNTPNVALLELLLTNKCRQKHEANHWLLLAAFSRPFRIGFWLGGIAPLFSSRSNKTNSFSISCSFSSSVRSGSSGLVSGIVVPVIGLMVSPEAVVNCGPDEDEESGGVGADITPLLKRNPATLPYPNNELNVDASESQMA